MVEDGDGRLTLMGRQTGCSKHPLEQWGLRLQPWGNEVFEVGFKQLSHSPSGMPTECCRTLGVFDEFFQEVDAVQVCDRNQTIDRPHAFRLVKRRILNPLSPGVDRDLTFPASKSGLDGH